MPKWLQVVSHFNPLTYQVDALRALMSIEGTSDYGLLPDFSVLLGTTAMLIAVAAKMYHGWDSDLNHPLRVPFGHRHAFTCGPRRLRRVRPIVFRILRPAIRMLDRPYAPARA